MGKIIDGKAASTLVKDEVRAEVEAIRAAGGRIPCLCVIIVGENPASQVYVRNKVKAAAYTGIESRLIELPADTTEETLLGHIRALNADPAVDGVLVQLPLHHERVAGGEFRRSLPELLRAEVVERPRGTAIFQQRTGGVFHCDGEGGLLPGFVQGIGMVLGDLNMCGGSRARHTRGESKGKSSFHAADYTTKSAPPYLKKTRTGLHTDQTL